VYFNGAYLDTDSQQCFIDRVIKNANLKPLTAPSGVETASRVRPDGTEITFVINHTQESKIFYCNNPALDLISGNLVSEIIELSPYGVAILKRLE
jgi:beta-galactosidase